MILFYMFDGRNVDKSTSLSAACSIVHQILCKSGPAGENFFNQLNDYREQTGQEKASHFECVWNMLSKQLRKISKFTLIIDGLDECDGAAGLLEKLIALIGVTDARLILLSRREAEFTERLNSTQQLTFGDAENRMDISSFLQSEISKSKKLSAASVTRKMRKLCGTDLAEVLSKRSNGLFLWAKSALRELECKATTFEIVAAAQELPLGLIGFYESILREYNKRLTPQQRSICCMILRWLVCAARPLSSMELWTAVRMEYLRPTLVHEAEDGSDSESELSSDEEFHFTCREIEAMCGSLVVNDDGVVQLAHISIAEFLRQKSLEMINDPNIRNFLVNVSDANLHLMVVCVEYLKSVLGHPPIRKEDRGAEHRVKTTDLSKPFLVYAVCQWPFHLIQSGVANLEPVRCIFKEFLLGPKMLYWLETWFAIDGQDRWTLQQQLKMLLHWCAGRRRKEPSEHTIIFLFRWSESVSQLLERHGSSLDEVPSEIHFIDPRSYDDLDGENSVFSEFTLPDPSVHSPHFQLQLQTPWYCPTATGDGTIQHRLDLPRRDRRLLRLFYVDKKRDVIFMTSYDSPSPELRCQDMKTGHKLRPMTIPCRQESHSYSSCEGCTMSPKSDFLILLHCTRVGRGELFIEDMYTISIWKLRDQLNFVHDDHEPWSQLVASIPYDGPSIGHSPRPLVVDSHYNLYHPWGLLSLREPSAVGFDAQGRTNPSLSFDSLQGRFSRLSDIGFSSDGRFMIAYDSVKKSLVRYKTGNMSLDSEALVTASSITIGCISHTGRLVVWRPVGDGLPTCYIQDFTENRCSALPGSDRLSFPTHTNLEFTLDEEHLVGHMSDLPIYERRRLSIWRDLLGIPHQILSQEIPGILGLHFTNISEPAYLAVFERWMEIDLSRLHNLLEQIDRQPETHRKLEVSHNGDRIGLISINQHK